MKRNKTKPNKEKDELITPAKVPEKYSVSNDNTATK